MLLFNFSLKVIHDGSWTSGSYFSRINLWLWPSGDTDYVYRQQFKKSINPSKKLFQYSSCGSQDILSLSLPSFRSYRYLSVYPGPKGTPFPLIAGNLVPELCMENELESTIWWHLVLMFPWKALDLRFLDRSICIYSWQLYGNLRGKPCIHEYCSSITMPHLKFRFLHCRRTCDADGLLIKVHGYPH